MVFRNKVITNIVITTLLTAGVTLAPGYISFIFDPNGLEEIPLSWFGLSVILFFVVWPIVFFYRSLTLPKSITFTEDRLRIELPFIGLKEVLFEDIVSVNNKSVSSYETRFCFKATDGREFRLILENYQLSRMIELLHKLDLPRKVQRAFNKDDTTNRHFPIFYKRLLLKVLLLVLAVTAFTFYGERSPVIHWFTLGASVIFACIATSAVITSCSITLMDSGTGMIIQYLLPIRRTRIVSFINITEYSVEKMDDGRPGFITLTEKGRILTIWLNQIHRGEQLHNILNGLFNE